MCDPSIPERICTKCGVGKPQTAEFFSLDHRGRLRWRCRLCISAYRHNHYKNGRKHQKISGKKRCPVCEEYKDATLDNFARDKRISDGFTTICRPCKSAVDLLRRNRSRLRAAPADPNQLKQCSKCGERKPADRKFFPPNQYRLDRLDGQCRECVQIRERERSRKNPHVGRAKMARRRARLQAVGGKYTAADVERQLVSQDRKCYWCKGQLKSLRGLSGFHVDHIIPISKGGSNGPENICCACCDCNLSKSNKMPSEFTDRLL